jgi:hypothetical protein
MSTQYIGYPPDRSGTIVTALDGITGSITLVAGTGISITPSGQNITITNTGTLSFPVLAPSGTAGAPSYSFSAATGTGLYNPTSTQDLGIAANGTLIATASNTQGMFILSTGISLSFTGGSIGNGTNNTSPANIGFTGSVAGANGIAGSPAFSSVSFPTSGMYFAGGGTLGLSYNGTSLVQLSANGIHNFVDIVSADLVFDSDGSFNLGLNNATFSRPGNIYAKSLLQVGDATNNTASLSVFGTATLGASGQTPQHVLNTSTSAPASGVGTLTNLPTGDSGNPTGYIKITINGGTHVIPYW